MGCFFGSIAKVTVKLIILPFLYFTYLYSVYLMALINAALTIYFVAIFVITGIDPMSIEYIRPGAAEVRIISIKKSARRFQKVKIWGVSGNTSCAFQKISFQKNWRIRVEIPRRATPTPFKELIFYGDSKVQNSENAMIWKKPHLFLVKKI